MEWLSCSALRLSYQGDAQPAAPNNRLDNSACNEVGRLAIIHSRPSTIDEIGLGEKILLQIVAIADTINDREKRVVR